MNAQILNDLATDLIESADGLEVVTTYVEFPPGMEGPTHTHLNTRWLISSNGSSRGSLGPVERTAGSRQSLRRVPWAAWWLLLMSTTHVGWKCGLDRIRSQEHPFARAPKRRVIDSIKPGADVRDLGEHVSDQTMSKVWILSGVTGSEPALLSHEAGQVTLSTFNDDDEPVPSFSVQTGEISDVKFPAYQFSGGCSLVADGQKYRISFLKPQNTKMPTYYNQLSGVSEIGSGRKAGKAWKKILST